MALSSSLAFSLSPCSICSNEATATIVAVNQCMLNFSSSSQTRSFSRLHCFSTTGRGQDGNLIEERGLDFRIDGGGGDGGSHDGGGGGGGDDGDAEEENEFGPILKFDEVMKEAERRGIQLPADMVEAAKTTGIREIFVHRYLDLQGSVWPLGFLMYCAMLRNRMLVDPSFLFKVGTEIVIGSSCVTFAEVQKRAKDFWSEFELYAADLFVCVVICFAFVGMLAPYARIGKPSVSRGLFGNIQQACAALPSSVFEAQRPGCKFSIKQRVATYFYKGVLYGWVGFGCGLIGQGIANLIMTAKRSIKKSEEDIPVPPLLESAVLWGVFLAVSSNTRYQIVNGLESLVRHLWQGKSLSLQWHLPLGCDSPTIYTAGCSLLIGQSGAVCNSRSLVLKDI